MGPVHVLVILHMDIRYCVLQSLHAVPVHGDIRAPYFSARDIRHDRHLYSLRRRFHPGIRHPLHTAAISLGPVCPWRMQAIRIAGVRFGVDQHGLRLAGGGASPSDHLEAPDACEKENWRECYV